MALLSVALLNQVDQLTHQIDQLTNLVDQLTNQVDQLTNQADQLTHQVDQLTNQVDQLTHQVDDVIHMTSRLTPPYMYKLFGKVKIQMRHFWQFLNTVDDAHLQVTKKGENY